MNFTTLVKKTIVAAILGVSIIAANIAGAGTAHAATSQSAAVTGAGKAENIVRFAESLQGKVRYVFGASNPATNTFDCSSFVRYVYATEGINLKWSSRVQSRTGSYVAKTDLQPGDLVFFSVGTAGKVNHVGIYIGDGQFIHNTRGKSLNGVVVSDLSKYDNRYITARRVL